VDTGILINVVVTLVGILAGMTLGYLMFLSKNGNIKASMAVSIVTAVFTVLSLVSSFFSFVHRVPKSPWNPWHVLPKTRSELIWSLFLVGIAGGYFGLSLLQKVARELSIQPPSKRKWYDVPPTKK
jgi:hypothetical protein